VKNRDGVAAVPASVKLVNKEDEEVGSGAAGEGLLAECRGRHHANPPEALASFLTRRYGLEKKKKRIDIFLTSGRWVILCPKSN
jgi:hypothetical protein